MISALPPSVDPGQGGSGSGGPESAGVPEPASRAMLVAGFGLAGSAYFEVSTRIGPVPSQSASQCE